MEDARVSAVIAVESGAKGRSNVRGWRTPLISALCLGQERQSRGAVPRGRGQPGGV